ncbi:hypothetical protein [Marisediminicola sp. LYQ134]|uniref:hypothetical protein n=1 Tax=Marisediminicola sp. LYQ134 TaxID=3391061 RepID=UPI0039837DE8
MSALIMSTVVGGLGYTSATRAGVQSQAAAESGIAVAAAKLSSDAPCARVMTSDTAPAYTATISYTTSSTLDAPGLSWVGQCPAPAATFVKIVSKGVADATGVAGNTRGDESSVEAIYAYSSIPTGIPATGSAVYTYSSGPLNQAKILSDGSRPASISIRNGNVDCTEASEVQGDVRAQSGSVSIQTPCRVNGSVVAGGVVNIYGKIGGSVSSASTGKSLISPDARIGGAVALRGSLDAWSPRCASPNTWDNAGNACAARQSSGATSVSTMMTGSAAPVAPLVPDWIDFGFVLSQWTDAGYTVVTWPNNSDHCTIDNRTKNMAHATALSSYTKPTVIDARNCSKLTLSSSAALTLQLKTDVTFVSRAFNIENFTARSSDGVHRELRFVVPDTAVNGIPTCVSGGVDINSYVRIEAPVAALIYTPCEIKNSTVNWRGQLFGGNVQFNSNSGLVYTPIGLPGVDLGGAVPGAPSPSVSVLGELYSMRDVSP